MVRIKEATNSGVIISALQVIETCFGIVIVGNSRSAIGRKQIAPDGIAALNFRACPTADGLDPPWGCFV